MSPDFEKIPRHVQRRVLFLLEEAKNKSPRDQVITFCMRALTNYATVAKDVSSYQAKILNQRISKEAELLLRQSDSLEQWAKLCINEHELPLKVIWEWLQQDAEKLGPDAVWRKFHQTKMVTVTKQEDEALNAKGLRSGSSKKRYSEAGISVLELAQTPRELYYRLRPERLKVRPRSTAS